MRFKQDKKHPGVLLEMNKGEAIWDIAILVKKKLITMDDLEGNVLIAVNDMDRAIRFYKEIFGLQVILDQDGNVIMSEGLVLQDAKIWQQFLDKELIPKNNMSELYFEEPDMEGFVKKLKESDFEIEFVNKLMTHSWGQKVVRFYDPDGNLIEVGTPMS